MNRPEVGELPPAALDALRAGRMIEAIKIVREVTGLGLKEAKDLVDAHSAARAETPAARAEDMPLEVLVQLRAGNKVEAIKALRAQTGMQLKDAHDAIRAHVQGHPGAYPIDAGTSRVRPSSIVALVAVAVLLFALFQWLRS